MQDGEGRQIWFPASKTGAATDGEVLHAFIEAQLSNRHSSNVENK